MTADLHDLPEGEEGPEEQVVDPEPDPEPEPEEPTVSEPTPEPVSTPSEENPFAYISTPPEEGVHPNPTPAEYQDESSA